MYVCLTFTINLNGCIWFDDHVPSKYLFPDKGFWIKYRMFSIRRVFAWSICAIFLPQSDGFSVTASLPWNDGVFCWWNKSKFAESQRQQIELGKRRKREAQGEEPKPLVQHTLDTIIKIVNMRKNWVKSIVKGLLLWFDESLFIAGRYEKGRKSWWKQWVSLSSELRHISFCEDSNECKLLLSTFMKASKFRCQRKKLFFPASLQKS